MAILVVILVFIALFSVAKYDASFQYSNPSSITSSVQENLESNQSSSDTLANTHSATLIPTTTPVSIQSNQLPNLYPNKVYTYNKDIPLNPCDVALVTYFAPQKNKDLGVSWEASVYKKVSDITLTNIAQYAHKQGYAFFFQNSYMVDTVNKAAYWGKMTVMRHYLDKGYKWVIWTDLDVLFMTDGSLLDEWLKKANQNQHIAMVDECAQNGNINARGGVRSGFIAIKNSMEGYQFLDAWADSYKEFGGIHDPEQAALERMVTQEPWKSMAYISDFTLVHTYPMCYDRDPVKAISMHFPAHLKNDVGRYHATLEKNDEPLQIHAVMMD